MVRAQTVPHGVSRSGYGERSKIRTKGPRYAPRNLSITCLAFSLSLHLSISLNLSYLVAAHTQTHAHTHKNTSCEDVNRFELSLYCMHQARLGPTKMIYNSQAAQRFSRYSCKSDSAERLSSIIVSGEHYIFCAGPSSLAPKE